MYKNIKILNNCILFKNLSEKAIMDQFSNVNPTIMQYKKGEIVALENSDCLNIGIVLEGKIEIQKYLSSGASVTIKILQEGQIFGEVIVFSKRRTYPATVTSSTYSKVMFISRDNIFSMMKNNNVILKNFMSLLSNKILLLNQKVKTLSLHSLSQKLANYLLEEANKQKSNLILLNCTKKELAELLGVPRPSLSRELINFKNNNLIKYDRKTITILNQADLEEILM